MRRGWRWPVGHATPRLLPPQGLEPQQLRGRHPQPLGDQADVLQADVPLAALNTPEVAPVDLDLVGERFLAHALLLAELADPPAEQHLYVLIRHPLTVAIC